MTAMRSPVPILPSGGACLIRVPARARRVRGRHDVVVRLAAGQVHVGETGARRGCNPRVRTDDAAGAPHDRVARSIVTPFQGSVIFFEPGPGDAASLVGAARTVTVEAGVSETWAELALSPQVFAEEIVIVRRPLGETGVRVRGPSDVRECGVRTAIRRAALDVVAGRSRRRRPSSSAPTCALPAVGETPVGTAAIAPRWSRWSLRSGRRSSPPGQRSSRSSRWLGGGPYTSWRSRCRRGHSPRRSSSS